MRTTIIIQARSGSKRLPGKVLAPFCGVPMLGFLIERLQRARRPHEIVLATTELDTDDAVARIGKNQGVRVVRGPVDDVLSRFVMVADKMASDVIVRICADNPLTDPQIIDVALDARAREGADHVSCFERPSYPYGVGCSVFTRTALDYAANHARDADDREHMEAVMLRAKAVQTSYLIAPPELARPDIRITVDEAADLERVATLAERLVTVHGMAFATAEIIMEADRLVHGEPVGMGERG